MSTTSRPVAPIAGPPVSLMHLSNYSPGNTAPPFAPGAVVKNVAGFVGTKVTPPSLADFTQRFGVSPAIFSPAQLAQRTIPGLVAQGFNGLTLGAKAITNRARSLGG